RSLSKDASRRKGRVAEGLRHDLFAAVRGTLYSHIRVMVFDAGLVLGWRESEPSKPALQTTAVNRGQGSREWGMGSGDKLHIPLPTPHSPLPTPHLELPQLNIPHRMIRAFFEYQKSAGARRQNVLDQIHAVDLVPD